MSDLNYNPEDKDSCRYYKPKSKPMTSLNVSRKELKKFLKLINKLELKAKKVKLEVK